MVYLDDVTDLLLSGTKGKNEYRVYSAPNNYSEPAMVGRLVVRNKPEPAVNLITGPVQHKCWVFEPEPGFGFSQVYISRIFSRLCFFTIE